MFVKKINNALSDRAFYKQFFS